MQNITPQPQSKDIPLWNLEFAKNQKKRCSRLLRSAQLAHLYPSWLTFTLIAAKSTVPRPRAAARARYGIFSASRFQYALATYTSIATESVPAIRLVFGRRPQVSDRRPEHAVLSGQCDSARLITAIAAKTFRPTAARLVPVVFAPVLLPAQSPSRPTPPPQPRCLPGACQSAIRRSLEQHCA